jgi:hypothetical protein
MKAQLRIDDVALRDDEEYTIAFLDAEIKDLKQTPTGELTTEYQPAVSSWNEAKQNFEKEKALPANSKTNVQPVREHIEGIMKVHGINFADFYGGRDINSMNRSETMASNLGVKAIQATMSANSKRDFTNRQRTGEHKQGRLVSKRRTIFLRMLDDTMETLRYRRKNRMLRDMIAAFGDNVQ